MKTRVFHNIEQIPEQLWEDLRQNRSITLSHAFWRIVEASQLRHFSYRYLVAYDSSEQLVGFMTTYVVTTDIAIFAPPWLRDLLVKVRRWAPNFLKWKMLECGTPININSPPWACLENYKNQARDQLLSAAQQLAKQERALVTVIRDFDPTATAEQQRMRKLKFALVDGLPNTILNLPWQSMSAYLGSMKSYYRSKLLKHVRRCEHAGMTYEVRSDFSELAQTLCDQWLLVHNNAKEYQREVLTPAFYAALSNTANVAARVVLIHKDGVVIAHALLLLDGKQARWMYFGRNTVANNGLYLFTAYAVIESAIKAGARSLELGVTNYQTKLDLGAHIEPLKFAISLWSGRFNRIAGRIYNLLNSVPLPAQRDVFKNSLTGN